MTHVQPWEGQLLDLAHEALDSHSVDHAWLVRDDAGRVSAYARCQQITRENSRTFYLAASLLPALKRGAVHALYALCRVSDDLVDQPMPASGAPASKADTAAQLEQWRQLIAAGRPGRTPSPDMQAVSLAWGDTSRAFGVPGRYVEQLIDGLASDLQRVRYDSFTDLTRYCYGVACTVGLMSMHIVGYTSRHAIPYAIRLGVALQLTNILRDVGEDWRSGRLYLPQDELDAFGVSSEQLAQGRVDSRWRSFMRFQIARARQLYAEALPGVALLHRDGRFAITAAGELYRAILSQIEANDYNVFSRRARVSAWGKLRRLPGMWLRSTF